MSERKIERMNESNREEIDKGAQRRARRVLCAHCNIAISGKRHEQCTRVIPQC